MVDGGVFIAVHGDTDGFCITHSGAAISATNPEFTKAEECEKGCATWGECVEEPDKWYVCDHEAEKKGNYIAFWPLMAIAGFVILVIALIFCCTCCARKSVDDDYRRV